MRSGSYVERSCERSSEGRVGVWDEEGRDVYISRGTSRSSLGPARERRDALRKERKMRKPDEARETREMRDRPSATTAIRNIRSTPTGLPLSHPNHPLAARQIPPNTCHGHTAPSRPPGRMAPAPGTPRAASPSRRPERSSSPPASLARPIPVLPSPPRPRPTTLFPPPLSCTHASQADAALHGGGGTALSLLGQRCAIRACPTPPSNYAPPPPPGLDALSSISVLGPHAL